MMAKAVSSPILQMIRRVVEVQSVRQLSDQHLLQLFSDQQDESAFGSLLRRHGSMVLDVCRGVLGNEADVEDAFQATFLILARKAASIRKRGSVGSWLHGVAYRTALKARSRLTTRQKNEARAPARTISEPDDLTWREVRQIVHEELTGLAERYRAPLVACYLEGKTQHEAVAQLGLATSTLKERLERGRSLLRARLLRRGLGPAAVLLATAWPSATASACLPPTLVSSTIKAASLFAVGQAAATGVISVKVAALTEGVLKTMFLTKLKLATAALVFAGFLASGVLAASLCAEPAKPVSARAEPARVKSGAEKKPQPAPQSTGAGTLLLAGEGGKLTALTPDVKGKDELNTPKDTRTTYQARLSPDGTRAAFVIVESKLRGPDDKLDDPWPFQVVIRKLGANEAKVVDFPGFGLDLNWAPDGKRLAVTKYVKDQPDETVLLDPETGKTEPLALPANVGVLDWSRGGKTFLVVYFKDKKFRLGLAEKGDKEASELTELKVRFANNAAGRLSPDGKKVLFTDADPEQKDAYKWHRSSNPYLLDVATKQREPLAEFPANAQCQAVAWSPDGKQVAYTWVQLHPELLKKDMLGIADSVAETDAFLIVADANGKNAKTVASGKSDQAIARIIGSIDWR